MESTVALCHICVGAAAMGKGALSKLYPSRAVEFGYKFNILFTNLGLSTFHEFVV